MTPDASQSGLEPAASLTSVRIKRRKQPLARSGKRGDLTEESGSGSPAAPEPVIALPPPASEATYKQIERIIDRIRPPAAPELPQLFEGLPPPVDAPARPESPPVIEATPEPDPAPPDILDLFALTPPHAPAPEPEMPEIPPVVELLPSAMQQEPETLREPELEPEPEPEREESSSFIELKAPAPPEPSAPEPANDVEPAATFRDGEAVELTAPFDEAEVPDEPLDGPEPEFAPVAAPEPRPRPVLVETLPEEPPAEAPAPAALDAEPAPEAGGADILDYWDSLRGGRDFPSLDELDRSLVAATWPNTVLLAIDATEMPRITRLGDSNGEVEYTASVIDWIMSRGRHAAKRGAPIEEEKRFPVSNGSARYRLLLLPFSSYGLKCDHVLGQLTRAAELGAVASFKRWLAS